MEFLIEFVVELFFELLTEGGMEIIPNKRVPKWLRYLIAVVLTLFFAVIIFGCIILGVLILKETLLGGMTIIALGVIMLVLGIRKFIKVKNQMQGD